MEMKKPWIQKANIENMNDREWREFCEIFNNTIFEIRRKSNEKR